ncbi:MAG: caspase family protein [Gemmataceae bacterium]
MPRTALAVACFLAAALAAADPPAGGKYALLVGVDKYDPAELRSLQYPGRDVTVLAETLTKVGYQNVTLMTSDRGQRPTARNVIAALDRVLMDRRPGDSVLVAFAGHGVQFRNEEQVFFCPADAKLDDRETLVSLSRVYKQLGDCPAGFKLLISDACRNDPSPTRSASRSKSVELESKTRPQRMKLPSGVVALFSCAEGQVAFESERLKHGVFFHHVIEGLKGAADLNGDGKVTINELQDYLPTVVGEFVAKEFGNSQQPNFLINQTGALPPLATGLPKRAAMTAPAKGKIFVGNESKEPETRGKRPTEPPPSKPAELQPVESRWGYKLYIEPTGALTCYGPISTRGFGTPYWTFKPSEGAITKVVLGPDDVRRRVAVIYGKKAAVLDFMGQARFLGGWPKDISALGPVTAVTFDDKAKTVTIAGTHTYRYDTESGEPQTINGKRVGR